MLLSICRDKRLDAVAAFVLVICYILKTIQPSKGRHDKSPDGKVVPKRVRYLPSKIPFLGNSIELLMNSARMHDWITEHMLPLAGEPFMLRLPGKADLMFLSKPEHLEQVLQVQCGNFPKSQHIHNVYFDLLGNSIVTSNGEVWKRQRRILLNLLNAQALKENVTPIVHKYVEQLRQLFENAATMNKPVDVFHLVHCFTLDVIADVGFGTDMKLLQGHNQAFAKAMDESQYIISTRFEQPDGVWKLKRWLHLGNENKLRHAVDIINDHIMRHISNAIQRHQDNLKAKKSSTKVEELRNDIVSATLVTQVANEVVNPVELRDLAVATLIAGRDTSADALSWLFYMLSENPRVGTELRSELITHVPRLATDATYVPTIDELHEVRYLDATIRELLRILPPGPLIGTHCIRDTMFPDGTFVPKNTDMGLAFYTTGRLTSVWGDDAFEFKPERFLDTTTDDVCRMPSSKFCAFSAGPRTCVGRNLAYIEMKLAIAIIWSRFDLILEPGQAKPAYSQGITLGMQTPLLMRVQALSA